MYQTNKGSLNTHLAGLKGSVANILEPNNTADLQGLVESIPPWIRALWQETGDQPNISLVIIMLCLIRLHSEISDWFSFSGTALI